MIFLLAFDVERVVGLVETKTNNGIKNYFCMIRCDILNILNPKI